MSHLQTTGMMMSLSKLEPVEEAPTVVYENSYFEIRVKSLPVQDPMTGETGDLPGYEVYNTLTGVVERAGMIIGEMVHYISQNAPMNKQVHSYLNKKEETSIVVD